VAITPGFWKVPGIPADQLEANCLNLQWRSDANVGLLQISPPNLTDAKISRYVKLETLFASGLAYIREEAVDSEPLEWLDMLQGVGVLVGRNRKTQIVAYLKPAHQRTIHYGEQALDVLVPPTLLGAQWTAGVFADAFVFIVREMTPTMKVSPWPWGNVYDSGRICWGGAIRPRLTPQTIKQLEPAFWETPFNRDLLYNYSITNWVRGLAPKPEEPYDLLSVRLEDLLSGRLEGYTDTDTPQKWLSQLGE